MTLPERRVGTGSRDTIRSEHDDLGDVELPLDAYYGAQTQRALDYSAGFGGPLASYPTLIESLAFVKKAAAAANVELQVLEARLGDAIMQACDEVIVGELRDQFVVDILAPSDTSHNMNMNEVLANRANQILGAPLGTYAPVHALDHVNRSQSTNDVMPTAVRLACRQLGDALCASLTLLEDALRGKAVELGDVVKVGRTCLQDALPLTFESVLVGYASSIRASREAIARELDLLAEVNLGGTAIGTGFNTPPGYVHSVLDYLSLYTGRNMQAAESLVGATQNEEPLAFLSSRLRVVALSLSKIANDLRLMASGPRAGLGEIVLSTLQAGSSMMPGKINPIVTLLVNHAACLIAGYDDAVGRAIEGAELELNPNGSLIAYCLFESFRLLGTAVGDLSTRCIDGMKVNAQACKDAVEGSVAIASALTLTIGYDRAANIAKAALAEGRTVEDVVVATGLLDPSHARQLLSAAAAGGVSTPTTSTIHGVDFPMRRGV